SPLQRVRAPQRGAARKSPEGLPFFNRPRWEDGSKDESERSTPCPAGHDAAAGSLTVWVMRENVLDTLREHKYSRCPGALSKVLYAASLVRNWKPIDFAMLYLCPPRLAAPSRRAVQGARHMTLETTSPNDDDPTTEAAHARSPAVPSRAGADPRRVRVRRRS